MTSSIVKLFTKFANIALFWRVRHFWCTITAYTQSIRQLVHEKHENLHFRAFKKRKYNCRSFYSFTVRLTIVKLSTIMTCHDTDILISTILCFKKIDIFTKNQNFWLGLNGKTCIQKIWYKNFEWELVWTICLLTVCCRNFNSTWVGEYRQCRPGRVT